MGNKKGGQFGPPLSGTIGLPQENSTVFLEI
jgi:hypothetical protein